MQPLIPSLIYIAYYQVLGVNQGGDYYWDDMLLKTLCTWLSTDCGDEKEMPNSFLSSLNRNHIIT